MHLSLFSMKHFSMTRWCDNRWKTKGKKWGRKVEKIANRDQENDRGRMNIGGGEEKDSLLGSPGIGEALVETMRTFPLPRPKCSFPFPMRLFFPSLALLALTAVAPTHPFLPLVISVLSHACILLSSYTYVRRLSDRSSSRFSSSRIRFQGRRNRVHQVPWSRVDRTN